MIGKQEICDFIDIAVDIAVNCKSYLGVRDTFYTRIEYINILIFEPSHIYNKSRKSTPVIFILFIAAEVQGIGLQ